MSSDPVVPSFLHPQPILPYFLRTRLRAPEQDEVQQAIKTAFREYYNQMGSMLNQLLLSKDARKKQMALLFTGLEYENLVQALSLALAAQVSIFNYYYTLSLYLDSTNDQRRGLELGQMVLSQLEAYPEDKLTGQLGAEFVAVIDSIAKRQFLLKQYPEAQQSYHKALELMSQMQGIFEEYANSGKAGIYHQLGYVAQEQRQFQQAEQYYQQALQIYIVEDNYRYGQAATYHQLGYVAQEQRQFQQAEQYHQQALKIYIEYNDRYEQAKTYHHLGMIAQEQRQFQQAEQYYQQALQIFIEDNIRNEQAKIYYFLGYVAQEQRQFQQAEQYYQQALQIFIEYNDRHSQAGIYGQLGDLASAQRQFIQAKDYSLTALKVFVEYDDTYNAVMPVRNLARLWRDSGDEDLPVAIAPIIGMSVEETKALLHKLLEGKDEGE